MWLTAAMFHLAAEHTPELFAPLRQLVFGGDVISPRHVERIRSLYSRLRMVNGYGPTENTTFTCCYVVPREYRAEGTLSIGRAIAHTTVHILDTERNELPAGMPGELATGGAGVALGYLGRPEATVEKFLEDPFSDRPGALLYLTGDRAVARLDGTIEFLGRIDRQVKIAGHRVELAAVENALSASPLVADAAVVVLAVPSGEKQLVACVALASPAQNAEATLRALVAGSVVAHFDAAALAVSGKITDQRKRQAGSQRAADTVRNQADRSESGSCETGGQTAARSDGAARQRRRRSQDDGLSAGAVGDIAGAHGGGGGRKFL